MKRILMLICLLTAAAMLFASCGSAENSREDAPAEETTPAADYVMPALVGAPSDYSDQNNWLNIPEIEYDVDTIYIYPTVSTNLDPMAPNIVPIDDADMRAAAQSVFRMQKGAFDSSTNVFAPYYRQSSLIALASVKQDEIEAFQMQEQRTDVYAALDYYFAHYNEGRPFILAGHSQGSMMVKLVLMDYMQAHPEYYKKMVAAYVVGYSVTQEDLDTHPYLKFAEGADDTGVVISWNTEGPGNQDQYNIVLLDGAISINPINWKRDDTYASADENLGTYVSDKLTGTMAASDVKADAQVDTERGVVICTTQGLPDMSSLSELVVPFFGPESYHMGDYTFYLDNISANVKLRTERFLASHNG